MLALQIIHTIFAILLIVSILMQQRGSGLGEAFGADSAVFTSRRGGEKVLYILSWIFGAAFLALTVAQLFLAA